MSGKNCPVCKRKNDAHAVSCIYCCTSLESVAVTHSTTTRHVGSDATEFSDLAEQKYIRSLPVPVLGIAFYLMDNLRPIAVCKDREFILGRKQKEIKEVVVDLIPCGGNEYGVSRRHAMIRRTENHHYEILDLDSTNGTALNNKRIVPKKPYPLPSGSKIRLGLLILFAIYREIPA